MAKTYTPVGWEDGEIISPAMADLETGTVTPAVVQGTTPINATNLNHMDEAIKELYDGGATSKDIVIGTEEDITEDTKILIDTGEIQNKGSEVVDSLQGNEIDKAPSVRAINNIFNVTVDEQLVGKYLNKNLYRKVFEAEVTNAQGSISVTVTGSTRIVDVVGKIYWNNYSGFTKFPYHTSDNDKASLYSLNSTVYSQYSFGSASSRIFQLEVYYTKD